MGGFLIDSLPGVECCSVQIELTFGSSHVPECAYCCLKELVYRLGCLVRVNCTFMATLSTSKTIEGRPRGSFGPGSDWKGGFCRWGRAVYADLTFCFSEDEAFVG